LNAMGVLQLTPMPAMSGLASPTSVHSILAKAYRFQERLTNQLSLYRSEMNVSLQPNSAAALGSHRSHCVTTARDPTSSIVSSRDFCGNLRRHFIGNSFPTRLVASYCLIFLVTIHDLLTIREPISIPRPYYGPLEPALAPLDPSR
jgi:hypothetical protein